MSWNLYIISSSWGQEMVIFPSQWLVCGCIALTHRPAAFVQMHHSAPGLGLVSSFLHFIFFAMRFYLLVKYMLDYLQVQPDWRIFLVIYLIHIYVSMYCHIHWCWILRRLKLLISQQELNESKPSNLLQNNFRVKKCLIIPLVNLHLRA